MARRRTKNAGVQCERRQKRGVSFRALVVYLKAHLARDAAEETRARVAPLCKRSDQIIPPSMGFGAASPAEARAKLEKLKLEAVRSRGGNGGNAQANRRTRDAVAKLAQKILRSSSIEGARQHAEKRRTRPMIRD